MLLTLMRQWLTKCSCLLVALLAAAGCHDRHWSGHAHVAVVFSEHSPGDNWSIEAIEDGGNQVASVNGDGESIPTIVIETLVDGRDRNLGENYCRADFRELVFLVSHRGEKTEYRFVEFARLDDKTEGVYVVEATQKSCHVSRKD